jgi:hypothetical protein
MINLRRFLQKDVTRRYYCLLVPIILLYGLWLIVGVDTAFRLDFLPTWLHDLRLQACIKFFFIGYLGFLFSVDANPRIAYRLGLMHGPDKEDIQKPNTQLSPLMKFALCNAVCAILAAAIWHMPL